MKFGVKLMSRKVPETDMRNLYELFRGTKEFIQDPFSQLLTADGAGAQLISEAFKYSVKKFSDYENADERFVPQQRGTPEKRWGRNKGKTFAKKFVLQCYEKKLIGFPFTYLDDEMSTFRTTASGQSDSGQGGIDLMLSTCSDSIPVIGEIKATSDPATPLAGLIQALTYTSELVTDSQHKRLMRWYGDSLSLRVGICMVLERQAGITAGKAKVEDERIRYLSVLAENLAGQLGRHVAFISAFTARESNDGQGGIACTKLFHFPG